MGLDLVMHKRYHHRHNLQQGHEANHLLGLLQDHLQQVAPHLLVPIWVMAVQGEVDEITVTHWQRSTAH